MIWTTGTWHDLDLFCQQNPQNTKNGVIKVHRKWFFSVKHKENHWEIVVISVNNHFFGQPNIAGTPIFEDENPTFFFLSLIHCTPCGQISRSPYMNLDYS